jgi:hypothetical protein
MWNRKHRRMVKRLVLSLAVFAALAPAAEARVDEIANITKASGQRTDDLGNFYSDTSRLPVKVVSTQVTRPDDRAARFSPSDVSTQVTRPDDRAARFSTDAIGTDLVSTRPDDRALRPMLEPATDWLGRPAAVILPEGPKWDGKGSDVVVAGDGFDWSDAGIGAATLFGALLLAGTGVLLVRGNRKLASV